jgi:hypothetical protein
VGERCGGRECGGAGGQAIERQRVGGRTGDGVVCGQARVVCSAAGITPSNLQYYIIWLMASDK